jgi:uncharacterized membrane protein (Fun14 family)
LITLGTEVASGAVVGYFLGWGMRLVLTLLFKIAAVAVACFTIPLLALEALGIVHVDFQRFALPIQQLFEKLISFATIYVIPAVVHNFPLSGSLALGTILGTLKK